MDNLVDSDNKNSFSQSYIEQGEWLGRLRPKNKRTVTGSRCEYMRCRRLSENYEARMKRRLSNRIQMRLSRLDSNSGVCFNNVEGYLVNSDFGEGRGEWGLR
jgi:hypothetical protein